MLSTYTVGVDAGGTKTKAILFDGKGIPISEGVSGPGNVSLAQTTALESILDAVNLSIRNANLTSSVLLSELSVCAGIAGSEIPQAQSMLNEWEHPFGQFFYINDLHAATLGAHGGKNGSVLISGTGSCAASLIDDQLLQFGGRGFLLGDQGSGAWLGKQAVVHCLLVCDGIEEKSALSDYVLTFFQCHSAPELLAKLIQASPATFGMLAPGIFELHANENAKASSLVYEAAGYLSQLAHSTMKSQFLPLVLVGSVAQAIKPYLNETIQRAIVEPLYGPEWGAMQYLKRNRCVK